MDIFAAEIEAMGQLFTDSSYDKISDPPLRVIKLALGRCMRKGTEVQLGNAALKQNGTQNPETPLVNQLSNILGNLGKGGWLPRGTWQPYQKEFGKGKLRDKYGGKTFGKGGKEFGKGWPTGKDQGTKQLNLTNFSREIFCLEVDEGNGRVNPAAMFIYCPFEGLPGGCRRTFKGGKECQFNHVNSQEIFKVYLTSTLEQTLHQFTRWLQTTKNATTRRTAKGGKGGKQQNQNQNQPNGQPPGGKGQPNGQPE